MHIVKSFIVRLVVDPTCEAQSGELHGVIQPVSGEEIYPFQDSLGLERLLVKLSNPSAENPSPTADHAQEHIK